jgi:carbamoyl-phosphate synthase large subunit
MKKKNILLTTAGGGNANNLVRSLKKSGLGYNIVGTNISKFELAKSIADKHYLIPRFDEEEYLQILNKIILREKIDFCIPNHEFEIQRIVNSGNKDLLSKCFLPSMETVNLCVDKLELIKKLDGCGMNVPKSITLSSYKDLEKRFDEVKISDNHPVWCRIRRGSGSAGAAPVYSKEEAFFWIQYWEMHKSSSISDFMLSEYLPGKDYHFFSLWQDGELVIGKSIQRMEYVCSKYTVSGTSSSPSLCKLVNDETVQNICIECVKAIDPNAQGLFGVDLKGNVNDVPYLTEINIGRFPRINYIFNFVGSNIAQAYINCGLGLKVQPFEEKAPQSFHYLIRDFDSVPIIKDEEEIKTGYISFCY